MKKLLILIVIAGGAYFGYQHFLGQGTAAYKAYEQFADAVLDDDFEAAAPLALADSQADDVAEEVRKYRDYLRRSGGDMNRPIPYRVERELKSQKSLDPEQGEEAAVEIEVTQLVRKGYMINPVGPATHKHEQYVVLVKINGSWKIDTFEEDVTELTDPY